MARPAGSFRTETAGSLTPELDRREKSATHLQRCPSRREEPSSPERRSPIERH